MNNKFFCNRHLLFKITSVIMLCFVFYSNIYSQSKEISSNNFEETRKKAEILLYDDPDKALQLANQVYNATKNEKNLTFAHTAGLLAEIYSMKGNQKKAIEYAEEGKECYENLGEINYSFDMLNIISKEYSVLGLFDESIKSNNKAIKEIKALIRKDNVDNNIRLLALAYDTRAYIFDQKVDDKDSMVKYNEMAYDNFMRLKPSRKNVDYQLMAANNLANTYLKMKDNDVSKKMNETYDILTKAKETEKLFPNKKARAYLTFNFGNYYYTKEKDSLALNEFNDAIVLAENDGDIYLQRNIHEMLALEYAIFKNKDKELYHQRKYNELSKKITLAEKKNTNATINNIQTKQEKSFFETKATLLWILLGVIMLLFISIFITVKNHRKSKKEYSNYQKIIEKLENQEPLIIPSSKVDHNTADKTTFSISQDKETEILEKLAEFEKTEIFRNKNLSLSSLAESLNTNTAYLSTVINNNKNKNFNNYINGLRINYIVNKLKNNPQYLKYKISHLAEESGFSSHNTFTTAFSNFIGVSPSNFIKFLSKEEPFVHK